MDTALKNKIITFTIDWRGQNIYSEMSLGSISSSKYKYIITKQQYDHNHIVPLVTQNICYVIASWKLKMWINWSVCSRVVMNWRCGVGRCFSVSLNKNMFIYNHCHCRSFTFDYLLLNEFMKKNLILLHNFFWDIRGNEIQNCALNMGIMEILRRGSVLLSTICCRWVYFSRILNSVYGTRRTVLFVYFIKSVHFYKFWPIYQFVADFFSSKKLILCFSVVILLDIAHCNKVVAHIK